MDLAPRSNKVPYFGNASGVLNYNANGYIQNSESMALKNKRVTMIKHTVGKVKPSAYALPGDDFVYGIESKFDKEGAGNGVPFGWQPRIFFIRSDPKFSLFGTCLFYLLSTAVVQSWAQCEPSQPPCSMQSFPATNRQALKNGCLTSKAQREYGKKFPVMKQNPKKSSRCHSQNAASDNACDQPKETSNGELIPATYQQQKQTQQPPQQIFGIQTKKNKVSMTELLRCIASELEEETDYPDLSGKKRKGRLPPAKSTKSSRLVRRCREPPPVAEVAAHKSVEGFKMKKFLNVPSKVKCYM